MGDPQLLRDVLANDALLVTPVEAAKLLRVGRTTVYALMKGGALRPVHIGRSCRLPRTELERYVNGLAAVGAETAPEGLRRSSTDDDNMTDILRRRPAAP